MEEFRRPLISIIIPVYNTIKYLEFCMNSVVRQDFRDIEVICVDDGSTDGSGEICNQYEIKSDFVKVIHQDNKGLIGARMRGLREARGEYVTFVDSDDFLDIDFFTNMVDSIDCSMPDIVVGSYVVDRDGIEEDVFKKEDCKMLTRDEALLRMFERRGFDWSGCAKLYKKELMPCIEPWWYQSSYGEDTEMNWKLFCRSKNILYTAVYGYHYRIHENSMMRTLSDDALVYFDRVEKIFDEIDSHTNDPRIQYVLNKVVLQHGKREFAEFEKMMDSNDDTKQRLIKIISDCQNNELTFYPFKDEINDFCKKYKNIYIYGMGHYGTVVVKYLKMKGITPKGFLVSQGHKRANSFFGVNVYEFEEQKLQFCDGIVISVKDRKDILTRLLEKGVLPERYICWYGV